METPSGSPFGYLLPRRYFVSPKGTRLRVRSIRALALTQSPLSGDKDWAVLSHQMPGCRETRTAAGCRHLLLHWTHCSLFIPHLPSTRATRIHRLDVEVYGDFLGPSSNRLRHPKNYRLSASLPCVRQYPSLVIAVLASTL